jgi:hypothetical protein
MGMVRFAKVLARSVTGSMNDLIRQATFYLAEGDGAPFEVSFRLNETPMSALTTNSKPSGIPQTVVRALADGQES